MCALFVATTPLLAPPMLSATFKNDPELQQFIVTLVQYLNKLALATNSKFDGQLSQVETISGRVLYLDGGPQEGVASFLKVIAMGALPDGTVDPSNNIAHNISVNADTQFIHIYGWATDPSTEFIPLPFASPTAGENIEVSVDPTDVTILTSAIDWSRFTSSYVVLEYINPGA